MEAESTGLPPVEPVGRLPERAENPLSAELPLEVGKGAGVSAVLSMNSAWNVTKGGREVGEKNVRGGGVHRGGRYS